MVKEVDILLSEDANINGDLLVVFNSVIKEFEKIFKGCPLGERHIVIQYKKENPLIDAVTNVDKYLIFLTVNGREYNQFVYQLGHELGHIYFDPRRSNWFIESCCDLISLFILERLTDTWLKNPPFPNWKDYALNFEKYAEKMETKSIEEVFNQKKLPNNKKLKKWLARERIFLKKEPENRNRNRIIGLMLKPLFERSLENWQILNFLGKATKNPPTSLKELDVNTGFDFICWMKAVPKNNRKIIKEIMLLFPKLV